MRVAGDHYPTPWWMVNLLDQHANIGPGSTIAEPCAGKELAIATYFQNLGHRVVTNDLHWDTSDTQLNAIGSHYWESLEEVDWVITNPPFDCHLLILKQAFKKAKVGVAFLLRVTADEMTMRDPDRYMWWVDHPEALQIKMPRYCFARSSKTGNHSVDSAYCQWMIWRKDGFVYPAPIIRCPVSHIKEFARSVE